MLYSYQIPQKKTVAWPQPQEHMLSGEPNLHTGQGVRKYLSTPTDVVSKKAK